MALRSEAVLVFPSTHHMLRAEALLKERGFRARLVPAPPQAGELCTTAIALPVSEGGKAVDLLEGHAVLVKAVLYPEQVGARADEGLSGKLASEFADHPRLAAVMEKLSTNEPLEREDIVYLLGMEEQEEVLCRAAETLTEALAGREVVPALVLDLSGEGLIDDSELMAKRPGGRGDLRRLREISGQMVSLGLVYLILSLGDRGELPWSPEEFREALGKSVVTVIHAERLPPRPGELVRDYGVRQILLRREDLYRMDPEELVDEAMFLRDNRPGPVGSGNLLPLFSGDIPAEERERRKVRAVLAVLRLVLGEAFLPLPEVLWRRGDMCGGNFLILEGAEGEIRGVLSQAEDVLAARGWSVRKAKGVL